MSLFPDDDEFDAPDRRFGRLRPGRSTAIGWYLIIGAIVATVVLGLLPAPYVIERPGPVFDTLGEVEIDGVSKPVIQIDGTTTYPTKGSLDLLTVNVLGTREAPPSWIEIAAAWFQPSEAIVPIDAIYPDGQTSEQADQESAAEMVNSQQEAVAAALEELGTAYTVTVGTVIDGAPAAGVLEKGDEFVSMNGTPIVGITSLRDQIAANGTDKPLDIVVRRAGGELPLSVTPVPVSANDPTPVIGIQAAYIFPYDVTIQLDNVGGPSAGTMFALGTYDKLTDGALTGGEHIAGTGTIRADGSVGAIGGIRQKMYGAQGAGATVFLAPVSNCDEVTGHIPSGLDVYAIATLDDAIKIVQAIGDGAPTSELARCPA